MPISEMYLQRFFLCNGTIIYRFDYVFMFILAHTMRGRQMSLCSAARKRIRPPDTTASTLLDEALKKYH